MAHAWQTCYIDDVVLDKFDIDTRHIRPFSKMNQTIGEQLSLAENENTFVDEWGVKRQVVGDYANLIDHPLRTASLEDLETFPWPDPADDYDFKGIREPAKKLYEENEYALVGSLGSPGNIFEQAWYIRGLEEFMKDLIRNKDFDRANPRDRGAGFSCPADPLPNR